MKNPMRERWAKPSNYNIHFSSISTHMHQPTKLKAGDNMSYLLQVQHQGKAKYRKGVCIHTHIQIRIYVILICTHTHKHGP